MRKVKILPEMPLETVAGEPILNENGQISVSQRLFMLKLVEERGFLGKLRGIAAARAIAAAKAEIERNFRENGACFLTDELWERLVEVVQTCEFNVALPGGGARVSVLHCMLPFMEALVSAEAIDGAVLGSLSAENSSPPS